MEEVSCWQHCLYCPDSLPQFRATTYSVGACVAVSGCTVVSLESTPCCIQHARPFLHDYMCNFRCLYFTLNKGLCRCSRCG